MSYTREQLLKAYNKQSNWIMMEGEKNVSQLDGVWEVSISIAPEDMEKAIPILHEEFGPSSAFLKGMKIASKALLKKDHRSGKEVILTFDHQAEVTKEGREAILAFLWSLALKFEAAAVKPESKPPLTVATEDQVNSKGSGLDKGDITRRKYNSPIQFREAESLSYFYYRDVSTVVMSKHTAEIASRRIQRLQTVEASEFDQWNKDNHSHYKHNPAKRKDDFLYGVVLENQIGKKEFLKMLQRKLPTFTRIEILDLFAEIKKPTGKYRYLHRQQHSRWDKVSLFFKSRVSGQGEENFWHTATYQEAVKQLKKAYIACGEDDHTADQKQQDAAAFIDYVRGNSPVHSEKTSTRKRFAHS